MDSLFETLQAEFCPPLDTSLLAALISELEPSLPSLASPSPSQTATATLRHTLRQLAAHAELEQQSEANLLTDDLAALNLSPRCSTTEDSSNTPDSYYASPPSSQSSASQHEFSSPIGFLQAAMPDVALGRLRRALSEVGGDGDGDSVNMEAVVERVLTGEYLRELEERGLDEDDVPDRDSLWEVVAKKKSSPSKAGKKNHGRGKTIALVDIRQKQHAKTPSAGTNRTAPPDPWTQLLSLSSHLATLLPPYTPAFFQPYFHSPKYPSPAKALRAALSKISESHLSSDDHTVLSTILDILRCSPSYATLDTSQRSTLLSDAELSLTACHGRGDDALDLVRLLHDLEADSTSNLELGVYHLPPPTPSSASPVSASSAWFIPLVSPSGSVSSPRVNGSGPPSANPPPTSKRKSTPPSPASPTSDQFEWHFIPPKKPPNNAPHPLALHIPAYASRSPPSKRWQDAQSRQRMQESRRKRDEMLREASKAWSKGNSKTRGGEVALYYAERAREYQEVAKREGLNEARIMVEAKRLSSSDRNTIDLHATSVAEAITIAKEILEREGSSAVKPLRIITGRGSHSANKTSVLKPAVKSALVQDGWNVGVWDGGLVVRGRRPGFVV